MIAAQNGHFEIVKFLLENECKFMRTDAYRKSALIYAVCTGNLKIASYLLTKGAKFDGCDSSGNSPLHYACGYGYYEMIPLLL